MTYRTNEAVERALADIETHVLEDVWLGKRRVLLHGALITLVIVTTAAWWYDAVGEVSEHGSNRIPTVAAAMLTLASAVSTVALCMARFRGCCAAAYTCGLGAVIGIGTFWWLRTGRPGAGLTWLMLADIAMVLLTVAWLSVLLTPLDRSQPEMRSSRP